MNLIFPEYPLRIEHREGKPHIWGLVRKKWLVLQKEEYVRQLLICYLVEERGLSLGRMSVEKEIRYQGMKRRFDLVVYDQHGTPWMLCECKAPGILINQGVLHQIARYNSILQTPYLLVTNGEGLWIFGRNEEGTYILEESIPNSP
ncbi:MAG: type I restriction enzyme HsdR N-terminal domain-containing protein [Bacteroidota bacterium]